MVYEWKCVCKEFGRFAASSGLSTGAVVAKAVREHERLGACKKLAVEVKAARRTGLYGVTVSSVGLSRLEHAIMPPMAQAISLPVLIDGRPTPLCVYVASSGFSPTAVTDTMVQELALHVAGAINRGLYETS